MHELFKIPDNISSSTVFIACLKQRKLYSTEDWKNGITGGNSNSKSVLYVCCKTHRLKKNWDIKKCDYPVCLAWVSIYLYLSGIYQKSSVYYSNKYISYKLDFCIHQILYALLVGICMVLSNMCLHGFILQLLTVRVCVTNLPYLKIKIMLFVVASVWGSIGIVQARKLKL